MLAAAWLAIPAVQYYATVERTRYQLGDVDEGATAPSLVEWDLTPFYLVLVLVTLVYVLSRWYLRRDRTAALEIAQEPGGVA